ncbi:MAG: hypothetical protein U0T73_04810 [Chitinophagales bacterium]
MKKIFSFVHLLLLGITFTSCHGNQPANAAGTEVKQDTVKASVIVADSTVNRAGSNKLNDVALFIAGLKPDSAIAVPQRLQNMSYYQRFCDTMNRGFQNMENNRFKLMRAWASTEMKEELAHPKTVFYPFSGPDILHCLQFYPDGDQYVMIALEKYGSLPVLDKMDSAQTVYTLNSITRSLEDIFGKSYFITRKMLRDVSNQWNGFTPLACVFLVRTNHVILDIKYKHLADDGTFEDISKDSCGRRTNDCVEIYFRKNGAEKVQKIIYFKTNLCDKPYGGMGSFTDNKALQKYLEAMPECYTYVKSASYLMNYPDFNIIRNICLKRSKSILQDDTGIAYRYIDKQKWNVKLYGSYTKPVSDFTGVFQDDLNLAYRDSSKVQKLNFSLGYHWGNQAAQNLMKFERK